MDQAAPAAPAGRQGHASGNVELHVRLDAQHFAELLRLPFERRPQALVLEDAGVQRRAQPPDLGRRRIEQTAHGLAFVGKRRPLRRRQRVLQPLRQPVSLELQRHQRRAQLAVQHPRRVAALILLQRLQMSGQGQHARHAVGRCASQRPCGSLAGVVFCAAVAEKQQQGAQPFTAFSHHRLQHGVDRQNHIMEALQGHCCERARGDRRVRYPATVAKPVDWCPGTATSARQTPPEQAASWFVALLRCIGRPISPRQG